MLRALSLLGASAFVGGATHAAYVSDSSATAVACKAAPKNECSFSPDEFRGFKLISSRYESHDTRRFYFALDGDATMNLPIASCVVCKFTDVDGKDITRPYTPISDNSTKGRFELLVKKYPKSKMGTHVFQLRQGEELLVKGPFKKFDYSANQWSHVGMIAGGTGIAPMFQMVQGILQNPKDKTKVSLVYANNARRDILLANELTEYQKVYPNFNLYLTLLDVPKRWLGGIGYINKEMVEAFMPKPGEKNTKILVCGPPPMMKVISGDKEFPAGKAPIQGTLSGLLKDMGYTEAQVFKY
jgi:cytochrome-b5 reductase